MPRTLSILLLALLLAACAPRAEILPFVGTAPAAQVEPVFVATTRVRTGATASSGRQPALSFARYAVNVPQDRLPGVIPYARPDLPSDPDKQFLVGQVTDYANSAAFRSELDAALRAETFGNREIIVYVHGYNNTYADGIYRLAQMRRDLSLPGVPVHYAWPSAGNALAYAYDRDSALFARDGLEQLLIDLTNSSARTIVVVAHSLGSMVTMEALRQLRIGGQTRTLSRIGGVILLSPDLDVDLFRSQAARIDPLPEPFVIFTSRRDRALMISARITGQVERLGNLSDIEQVADLDVTLVDVSNATIGQGDGLNHFTAATSPTLISLLGRVAEVDAAFQGDPRQRLGLLPGTVLTVRNATQVILAPGIR